MKDTRKLLAQSPGQPQHVPTPLVNGFEPIDEDTRQRGIDVYPMPQHVSSDDGRYALLVRADGQVRMVHTEGVAYAVTADKPWRYDDRDLDSPTFTPSQLITLAFYSKPVDLADWVRTFGARLESNFGQIVRWNNEVTV